MAFDTNVKTDIIDPFVIESVAGDRIADFCQDYNTYFMTLIPKDLTSKHLISFANEILIIFKAAEDEMI